MASRGVHFAIETQRMDKLLSSASDDELMAVFREELEKVWDQEWLVETDEAWDAIHRCLTNGKLETRNGSFPLNACILGGQQLYQGDEYIVSFIHPIKVAEVAEAIAKITKQDLRDMYFSQLDKDEYEGQVGEEDFEYTWEWFADLPYFFQKVADHDKGILFVTQGCVQTPTVHLEEIESEEIKPSPNTDNESSLDTAANIESAESPLNIETPESEKTEA